MDRQRAEEAANAVWPDCPQDVSSSDSSKGTAAKGEFVQEVSKATNISERTVRRVLHRIEGMTDEQAVDEAPVSEPTNCRPSDGTSDQPQRSDARGEADAETVRTDATDCRMSADNTATILWPVCPPVGSSSADREAKAAEKKAKADAAKKAKTEEAKKKADAEAKQAADAYDASLKAERMAMVERRRAEEGAEACSTDATDCRMSATSSDANKSTAKADFTREVAKATNLSERTVQRVLRRIEGMTDEQAVAIEGTSLDTPSALKTRRSQSRREEGYGRRSQEGQDRRGQEEG